MKEIITWVLIVYLIGNTFYAMGKNGQPKSDYDNVDVYVSGVFTALISWLLLTK